MSAFKYLLLGLYFGIILIKSEAVSWYRIIEMFHFQSFHLFGVISSAILIGIVSVFLIKKWEIKTISNQPICINPKKLQVRANFLGGIVFGLGWSLVGACTAPLFIHLGSGSLIIVIPIVFAIIGTYLYLRIQNKLPH